MCLGENVTLVCTTDLNKVSRQKNAQVSKSLHYILRNYGKHFYLKRYNYKQWRVREERLDYEQSCQDSVNYK